MWNRQREAQEAREKLAMMADEALATARNAPPADHNPLAAPVAAE
jgi:ATP-binding cassette subfamily B protein